MMKSTVLRSFEAIDGTLLGLTLVIFGFSSIGYIPIRTAVSTIA